MAIYKSNFTILVAVVSTTMLLMSTTSVNGQGGGSCDLQGLVTYCAKYVQKNGQAMDPSQDCCNVVKKADIPCTCKSTTKEIEAAIDMAKLVRVTKFCGNPIPSGTKCGSYVVPASI